MPKRQLHHYLPPQAVAPQGRHPELAPLANQTNELDSLDYTLGVIDGNLRAACELDGELLKLNHNVMELLNTAANVLREGLHSPNEDTRLKTAMHVTSRFNLKTVHTSIEKTKQVQISLRAEMVERKEKVISKLATPQNPKSILPAPLTPQQEANPPRHPSRLEDFSPLAKPLLQALPTVVQHNVYNGTLPLPDLQTLQLHWDTWGYTTFRYDFDYRGEIRKSGKKLGVLYRTTPHNQTRYVVKNPVILNACEGSPKGMFCYAEHDRIATPPINTPSPPPCNITADNDTKAFQAPWDDNDTHLTPEQLNDRLLTLMAHHPTLQHQATPHHTKHERAG
jgi:hypothetical protein